MNRIISIVFFVCIQNLSFGQIEFNQCTFFEDFFSNLDFSEIPYYKIGSPKPKILVSDAKDTIVESINPKTYETEYVNQKILIEQQWQKFNDTNQYIESRDLEINSFHLINLHAKLRKSNDIRDIVKSSYPEIELDSLIVVEDLKSCKDFVTYHNQNFKFNNSLENLSIQEQFNLRGYFRFGTVFYTSDKKYAITTFDVYHKWVYSLGEETEMETGGGGIIVIDLINEQKIKYIKQLSQY